MAFRRFFCAELARDVGNTVEVATDNNLITGVLVAVEDDVIRVVETTVGYTPTQHVLIIPFASINYVRILGVA
jgi:hypothetical protein